jgi:predicted small metal-binding protein
VAKTFRCQDAGLPCGFKATGQGEDEVVAKAVAHALQKHGVDLSQAKTLESYARRAITDDSQPRPDAPTGAWG